MQFQNLAASSVPDPAMPLKTGMLLILADGTIQAGNAAAEEMLGVTIAQIRGCTLIDCPWQIIHPDNRPFSSEHYPAAIALKSGKPSETLMGFYKPSGELRWLQVEAQPLFQDDSATPYAVITTFTDITESQSTRTVTNSQLETIQQQLAELEAIYNTASVGLCFWDTNLRYVRINQALAEMNGIPVCDHIGRTLEEALPEIGAAQAPIIRQVIETGEPLLNMEVHGTTIAQPGVERDWLVSYIPLKADTGEMLGVNVMVQEITELKKAQARSQESDERFQSFFNANLLGVLFGDVEGGIHAANDEFLRIVGYSREELEAGQLRWTDITPPEYLPLDAERIAEAQIHGVCTPYEKEYIRKDGSRVSVLIGYSLCGEQRTESVVFILDLTTLNQTKLALQNAEERLKLATQAAHIGTFEWNIQTNEMRWSVEEEALYGLSPGGFEGKYENWQQRVHPDDLAETSLQFQRSAATGEDLDVEFRIIRPDGAVRWIHAQAQVFPDDRGQPLRMIGVNQDISDRKLSEIELRTNQERLRIAQLVGKSGTWDWNFTEGTVFWSDEYYQLYGLDHSVPSTYENWLSIVVEADREVAEHAVREALEKRQPTLAFEFRIHHPTGGIRWFASRSQIFYDTEGLPIRAIGISLDITDLKETEMALRESETNFRTLADAMPQIFWTAKPNGDLDYYNQRWYDYTGLTFEQTKGWGWNPVLHPEDVQACVDRWSESIRTGCDFELELRFKRASDGKYRWHLGRAFPLRDAEGNIVKWFGSSTDIHDQKQAIAARDQAIKQERIAREQAEAANRIKDEFLAVISHELRTPLNPILGWSKLLQSGKLNKTQIATALDTIQRNAQRQAQLIEDLLDMSRILRGKLQLERELVNLSDVITAAIDTVRLAADAKQIHIETHFSQVAIAWGDATRLQQIVWNLLSNAVKFTPEQGRIDVFLDVIDAHAQLRVTDTGKGIASEFLPSVFERFQQEDSSTTRKFGGLGLGLAIVRQLVELHGGTVSANSPGENQGATFTVKLPLAETTSPYITEMPFPTAIGDLSGVRVLVVDDEVDSLDLLEFILQEAGATVFRASSAQEALQEIAQLSPTLIVSDIGMPEMNGYTLIEQVRATTQSFIPAIALTAYASDSDQSTALSVGYQAHLAKPMDPNTLIETILTVIEKR